MADDIDRTDADLANFVTEGIRALYKAGYEQGWKDREADILERCESIAPTAPSDESIVTGGVKSQAPTHIERQYNEGFADGHRQGCASRDWEIKEMRELLTEILDIADRFRQTMT